MLIGSFYDLEVVEIEGKGLGVITKNFIPKNEIIEICHVVEHFSSQDKNLKYYNFTDKTKKIFIPFGMGCIYNHSDRPNIMFNIDHEKNIMIFTSIKDIEPNDELCHNYGYNLKDWV